MRISKTQKYVLKILSLLESRGRVGFIENMQLLGIVRKQFEVADTNFRTSCHKLVEHGLLLKLRDPNSCSLAFELSEAGRKKAEEILLNEE